MPTRKFKKSVYSSIHAGNIMNDSIGYTPIPSQFDNQVHHIDERLFNIHTRDIISELTHITIFFREFDSVGFESSKALKNIYEILTRLRFGYDDHEYMKVVQVVTKYLNGMRKFLGTTEINEAIIYKKIFESTLLAIMFELNSFEERMS